MERFESPLVGPSVGVYVARSVLRVLLKFDVACSDGVVIDMNLNLVHMDGVPVY